MAEVRKRYLCGHCNEFVCKTIYHKHKQLYYNKEAKKWCTERVVDLTSEEFSFEDDDPEPENRGKVQDTDCSDGFSFESDIPEDLPSCSISSEQPQLESDRSFESDDTFDLSGSESDDNPLLEVEEQDIGLAVPMATSNTTFTTAEKNAVKLLWKYWTDDMKQK